MDEQALPLATYTGSTPKLDRFLDFIFRRKNGQPPCMGVVAVATRIRDRDPETGRDNDLWRTVAAQPGEAIDDRELYVCLSTLNGTLHAFTVVGLRRTRNDLVQTYAVVADDVGTAPDSKVRPQEIPLQPTYRLETSPGNEQWGFVLAEGVSPAHVEPVINGMIDARLTDPGASGAYRVVRVPGSINRKNPEAPFAARLIEMTESRVFTLDQLVSGLGITPRAGPATRAADTATAPRTPRQGLAAQEGQARVDIDELRSALSAIPQEGPKALPRDKWVNVGLALRYDLGPEAGFKLWEEFSRRYPGNDAEEIGTRWRGFNPDGSIHVGTIFHMATQHGWSHSTYQTNHLHATLARLRSAPPLCSSPVPTTPNPGETPAEPNFDNPSIVSGVLDTSTLLDFADKHGVTSISPASELPPTEWLLKHVHACKYVGVTAGVGGLNKTQLALVEAISIATGIDLLEYGGVRKAKVLILNKEESRVDILKRLRGIVLHYRGKLGLTAEPVDGFDFCSNLQVLAGRDLPLLLGRQTSGNWSIDHDAFRIFGELIVRTGARLVIIDPMLLFHELSENDNMQMGAFMKTFGHLAENLDIAVEIVAHNRKGGEAGDIDNVRGAGAIIAQARRGRVLTRMTQSEAGALGVPPKEAGYYFRIDNGKANLLPPAEKAAWFKSPTVWLDNGTADLSADAYGVPERYKPRPVLDGTTYEQVVAIHGAAGGAASDCRARYKKGGDGWFGYRAAVALGFDLAAEGTNEHKAAAAAMKRQLEALTERHVLKVEAVNGVASQGREAQCYRQGRLPSEAEWAMWQGIARLAA